MSSHEQRNLIVKERVKDRLGQMGDRSDTPHRRADAREEFCRTAIRVAKDRGLKLWANNYMTHMEAALDSLKYLLGEKKTWNSRTKKTSTGRNAGWVLDIWEATLDHYSRDPIFSLSSCDSRGETIETKKVTDEDLKELNEGGPTVFKVADPKPRLSLRILEAHVAGDADAMMGLLLEVEQLEAA